MRVQFRRFVLVVATIFFALNANSAPAQDAWTNPWHILEAGISVQFYQASNNTCTWRFWNTANSQTLQAMKFTVTYPVEKPGVAYNPYVTKTDNDVLPMPLDAGKWLGGWTAFTAPAMCRNVTLHVMDRTWGSSSQASPSGPPPPQIRTQYGRPGVTVPYKDSYSFDNLGMNVTSNEGDGSGDTNWRMLYAAIKSIEYQRGPDLVEISVTGGGSGGGLRFDNAADATAVCNFLRTKAPRGAKVSCTDSN